MTQCWYPWFGARMTSDRDDVDPIGDLALPALLRALEVVDLGRMALVRSINELNYQASGERSQVLKDPGDPAWEPPPIDEDFQPTDAIDPIKGRWLSLADAGEWLGVGEAQVRLFIRRGVIPAVRIGDKKGPIRVPSPSLWAVLYRMPADWD